MCTVSTAAFMIHLYRTEDHIDSMTSQRPYYTSHFIIHQQGTCEEDRSQSLVSPVLLMYLVRFLSF